MSNQELSSVIWKFFTIDKNDESKAQCNSCGKPISRGGKDKHSYGHSGLRKHLSTHSTVFRQYDALQKEATKDKVQKVETKVNSGSQQKLELCINPVWKIDDARSQALIDKIAKFICLDQQPLSVVENKGFLDLLKHLAPKFKCPSRHYFTSNVIPKMYERAKVCIDNLLKDQEYLSFTCGFWTSRSLEAYCSLTVHYISEKFDRHEYVLSCSYFPGEII